MLFSFFGVNRNGLHKKILKKSNSRNFVRGQTKADLKQLHHAVELVLSSRNRSHWSFYYRIQATAHHSFAFKSNSLLTVPSHPSSDQKKTQKEENV